MRFRDYLNAVGELHDSMGADLRARPPASPDDLDVAAQVMGGSLQAHIRRAWRVADGSAPNTSFFARPGFLTALSFLSVREALDERGAMERRTSTYGEYRQTPNRSRRIRPGWFNTGWLPFAGFGGGSLLLISDSSPTKHGKRGQVIAYVHDPDEIVFVASDFSLFLKRSLASLQRDKEEHFGA